jgi:APA family basic amino acid/polyamine antiporter
MPATTRFRRTLGPWSAAALVAGSMIGTGIFYFVSPVAERIPSRLGILAVWVAGSAIATCGALCLAELAAAYPETGGVYVFLRRAFGTPVAFLYAWAKFLVMRVGSLAIPALAFADFAALLIEAPDWIQGALRKSIALGVVFAVTLVNVVSVRTGSAVQNVFTAAKVVALLAMVGVGIAFGLELLDAHPIALASPLPQDGPPWLLFAAAMIPVMWTFGGWDESPFVAEEVTDPQRNLPISILFGLCTTALLFVLVNAAYLAILTPAELAASGGHTATLAMQRAVGPRAELLLSIALMVSTFGAANGMALTGGRIAYAVGSDHPLFRWLAHIDPRTRTPVRGLTAQCCLAVVAILALASPIDLLFYTGVAYWVFCALTAAAVIVLRHTDPSRIRPFRVWGYPATPILFIVASLVLAGAAAFEDPRTAVATALILMAGAMVYGIERILASRS